MNQPLDPIPPDDLDLLLLTWAAQREAPADRLTMLQQRIVSQLAGEPKATVLAGSPSPGDRLRWPQAGRLSFRGGPAWFLAGAASVLFVLGAALWLSGGRAKNPALASKTPTDLSAGVFSFSSEQLLAKAHLFAEMRAVFGGQLDWVAEATDHIELGLTERPPAGNVGRPLIVRVVVERRTTGGNEWKPIWATDVVALNEETVNLRPTPDAVPAALSLWAYRLPDGMVFVESDLTFSGSQPAIRAASVNVLENNRATQVSAGDTDGGRISCISNSSHTTG